MCLGETGARFIAAKPSELLASGRIHHFAWPLYRAENFRDKQPLPEGEHGVLDGFAPLALKVPLRYQSMGYAPEPLESLHSFTPTMAGQPLLEGAAEEDAVSDMPRAVTKSADTTAVPADSVDKETAATGDGRGASASALDGAGEAVALVGTATPTTTDRYLRACTSSAQSPTRACSLSRSRMLGGQAHFAADTSDAKPCWRRGRRSRRRSSPTLRARPIRLSTPRWTSPSAVALCVRWWPPGSP